MTRGISKRIMALMYNRKVSSYKELKDYLHEDKKDVSSCLYCLCLTRKLKRLPFSTKFGKVVYLPSVNMKQVWKYLYDNDVVPSTTSYFFKIMAQNKCVSTYDLEGYGLDKPDIFFFEDKFCKEWKLFKVSKVENFKIFYRNEKELKEWMEENRDRLKRKVVQDWKDRNEKGKELEDVVARYYELQNFKIRRRVWFQTPISKERLEIDILATLNLFPEEFENQKPLIVAVQCKYWLCGLNKEHIINPSTVMLWSSKVREIFPNAVCDFWGFHISNNLFKKSVLWNNSYYRLFSSKEIAHAFKVVHEKEEEKEKIEKEVKT